MGDSVFRQTIRQLVETERLLAEACRRLDAVPQFQHASEHFMQQVMLHRAERAAWSDDEE